MVYRPPRRGPSPRAPRSRRSSSPWTRPRCRFLSTPRRRSRPGRLSKPPESAAARSDGDGNERRRAETRRGKVNARGLERRRDERARGQTKSGDDDRPARTVEARVVVSTRPGSTGARPLNSPLVQAAADFRGRSAIVKIVFAGTVLRPTAEICWSRRKTTSRLVVFRRSVDVWRGKWRMAVHTTETPGRGARCEKMFQPPPRRPEHDARRLHARAITTRSQRVH